VGLAKQKIITKGLPSQNYKGRLTYVGGFSEAGKTTSVLDEVPRPFLFFCTDVSNPAVKRLRWVEDSDEDLEKVKADPFGTYAVRCYNHNPRILEYCRDHRRAYVLDEIANLFFEPGRMKTLLMYAREVRYIDGGLQVWATSQRPAKDVWPGIYFAAHRIKWVGPLFDDAAIKTLFSHRNSNMVLDEFRVKLANLKPYSWKTKNAQESILVVKDI
jgi:hypothetical protein